MDINIDFAKVEDIFELSLLNQKWLKVSNSENGFLFGDAFTIDDFKKIIIAKELVVAKAKSKIVGYYLIDNYSNTQILETYRQYVNKLILDEKIFGRISLRAQAVVDDEFQNLGISKLLLNFLLPHISNKYDFLFSVVSKSNPKIIAHQKSGWQIISENSSIFFVVFPIGTSANSG